MSETDFKDGYDYEAEDIFITYMIRSPELYARSKSITSAEYFEDKTHKKVIQFIDSYSNDYNALPDLEQIKTVTGKTISDITPLDLAKEEWYLKEYEMFCRYKALRLAILDSADLLEKNRFGEVETLVKHATQIGLVKDLGTNFFADPKGLLEKIKNSRNQISTGWKTIDEKLYGGLNKGEITIFAGQPGAGKSLFLQNLAVNWVYAGLNVVYISLELSEALCSMRIYAMMSGYETREILKNIDDVHLRVNALHKKHKGELTIKQMPNGCTTNDLRAYVKELEIQQGKKVDALLVDYLDLMMPIDKKVSPSDMFVKDKYVSENLRNLSIDLHILMATASQLNRGSYEEVEYDPSHISGGISKVNTADNVAGIFTSMAMKENGRYQIQFIKTRSSAGVGSKIDLAFDKRSLRITDLEEGEADNSTAVTKSLMDGLKKKTSVTGNDAQSEVPKEMPSIAESAVAIRQFLKRKT
jgi:replicative DNA helicase